MLSGLSGVSAAEHLKKIAAATGVAGALLVGYSGLTTGTAAEHLLADAGQVVRPVLSGGGGGVFKVGRRSASRFVVTPQRDAHDDAMELEHQIRHEEEIIVMAVARLIVSGALG